MPRSEVAAVFRSLMPRTGRCASLQYGRQGDTVTALMGPPERSSTILPVEEVSGGPEKAHVPETGSSDGSASSVSAPARTIPHTHLWRPKDDGSYRCINLWHCPMPSYTPTKPALAQEHSETSKRAAASLSDGVGGIRGKARVLVYDALRAATGGLTSQELETVTGMPGNTVRPRLVELTESGAVTQTTRTRTTRSGRAAFVYEVAR